MSNRIFLLALSVSCLNLEWFESIDILNKHLQEWWQVYNSVRPHSSIGYRTQDEEELLNEKF
ncbi:MAG: transposase InsO family protein [Polaribacter sp.]|jgi:transposase InsO family protein